MAKYCLYNLLIPPLFFYLLFFLIPYASSSASFKISSFKPDEPSILYHGDATPSDGIIELNKVAFTCRVGWATFALRVRLWDSNTGKLTYFTTNFYFTIDTRGSTEYGNGFAFFLAPVGFEIPRNSVGGYLGLFNTTTSHSSRNRIVLVEFDSFPNPEWDPIFEHGGINNNSMASRVYT